MRDASVGYVASLLPSILLVDRETRDVSSTRIRQACREGQSIRDLVPALVDAHIRRHALYGALVA